MTSLMVSTLPTTARPPSLEPASLEVARVRRRLRRPVVDADDRDRDQVRLAELYQAHPACRAAVVDALMPLARSAARSIRTGSEPRDDVEQVAALGMITALRRFDPRRGHPFAAFAVPTVRGEVRRHLRDTAWAVHVPRATKQLALRVRSAEVQGDRDRDQTVASHLGATPEAVAEARLALACRHADELIGETVTARPQTGFPTVEQIEQRVDLGRMSRSLPHDQRLVLALGLVAGLPQTEIAARLGITQMQVSRLRARALETMRRIAGA